MKNMIAAFVVVCLLSSSLVFAVTPKKTSKVSKKSNSLENVHLFQNFLRDATIAKAGYGEAGLSYASSSVEMFGKDYSTSTLGLGVQGGYPINPRLEANAGLGFLSISPEEGDGESGLSDLYVGGRYNLVDDKALISAGGFVTLPIGEEKIGQSYLNFGAFGALRYPMSNGMVITGTAGLDFLERKTYTEPSYNWQTGEYTESKEETEYKSSFVLGGGLLYPQSDVLTLVGELVLKTEVEYMMLSAGADYTMNAGKLRGAIGIGLDDGAPDFQIMGSFLLELK